MYLLRLMRGIRQRGHEPLLFGVGGMRLTACARDEGIPVVEWKQRAVPAGGETSFGSGVPPSRRGQRFDELKKILPRAGLLLVGQILEAIRLKRLFATHPVDVMHINVHGYEVAGVACRWARVPCVGVYCISPVKTDRVRRFLIRQTARFYTLIICKSPIASREWAMLYGLNVHTYIRNGVDVQKYAAASFDRAWTNNPLIIVAAGRLANKGFENLIEAIARVPHGRVKLLIAGDGKNCDKLQHLIDQLNLQEIVRLEGLVEDMPDFYAKGHCFSAVSQESWAGSTVLEAMASGLLVVAGNDDVIQPGITGWICPYGNPEQLAQTFNAIALLPCAQRQEVARNAQREALANFSNERMIAETEQLYLSMRS